MSPILQCFVARWCSWCLCLVHSLSLELYLQHCLLLLQALSPDLASSRLALVTSHYVFLCFNCSMNPTMYMCSPCSARQLAVGSDWRSLYVSLSAAGGLTVWLAALAVSAVRSSQCCRVVYTMPGRCSSGKQRVICYTIWHSASVLQCIEWWLGGGWLAWWVMGRKARSKIVLILELYLNVYCMMSAMHY